MKATRDAKEAEIAKAKKAENEKNKAMKEHARKKNNEESQSRATSAKMLASSLPVAIALRLALESPAIPMVPAVINKTGEKAEVEVQALMWKAEEKLKSSDPEPWDVGVVNEWPTKLTSWK